MPHMIAFEAFSNAYIYICIYIMPHKCFTFENASMIAFENASQMPHMIAFEIHVRHL